MTALLLLSLLSANAFASSATAIRHDDDHATSSFMQRPEETKGYPFDSVESVYGREEQEDPSNVEGRDLAGRVERKPPKLAISREYHDKKILDIKETRLQYLNNIRYGKSSKKSSKPPVADCFEGGEEEGKGKGKGDANETRNRRTSRVVGGQSGGGGNDDKIIGQKYVRERISNHQQQNGSGLQQRNGGEGGKGKGSKSSKSERSAAPTIDCSSAPSVSAGPSAAPSLAPSAQPSEMSQTRPPSSEPSSEPSWEPSSEPSAEPSLQPSAAPSSKPSFRPSAAPSATPTNQPVGGNLGECLARDYPQDRGNESVKGFLNNFCQSNSGGVGEMVNVDNIDFGKSNGTPW